MNSKHNISAVIIARNEEQYIKQCIESILPITGDIIVVDSGSTDQTIQIALDAGAQVIESPWLGYGATKNLGSSKAKFDWILSIDADEVLNNTLQQSIINLSREKNTIYQINSLVNYAGQWIKHCGWYPVWKSRLFNRTETSWNLDPVHEDLITGTKHSIKRLDGKLLHYSYDSKEEHEYKTTHYGKLKSQKWIENNKSVSVLKRLLGPSFRFFKTYIIQLGFLDGKAGYHISKVNAKMIRTAINHYDHLKTLS